MSGIQRIVWGVTAGLVLAALASLAGHRGAVGLEPAVIGTNEPFAGTLPGGVTAPDGESRATAPAVTGSEADLRRLTAEAERWYAEGSFERAHQSYLHVDA